MTVVRYKRAAAETPGKHGVRDWRITFDGAAPKHSETLFMLGMKLIAEDRFDAPHHLGRYDLWRWVDMLLMAKTPERVLEIAQDCEDDIQERLTRKRQRLSA